MKTEIRIIGSMLAIALVGCGTFPEEPGDVQVTDTERSEPNETAGSTPVFTPSGWTSFKPADGSSPNPELALYVPRVAGDTAAVSGVPLAELRQLRLVATDLVAALVQIPELNPVSATLQVSAPKTAFGNIVVRGLEEAGYGLQRIQDDAGQNYVSYQKRTAETDAGPVNDYEIAIGVISVEREYIVNSKGIYPSSLMSVTGTREATNIALADEIFREQGGQDVFISGVDVPGRPDVAPDINEVNVNEYDETPLEQRTAQRQVFADARRRNSVGDGSRTAVNLDDYDRFRRAVLIFNDNQTRLMGTGNKQAVRLLVREYETSDLFEITACTDADGSNDSAVARGVRVEEEFLGHGLPVEALVLAPCRRADFRHPNDDSPSPVEIVHHRRKENL